MSEIKDNTLLQPITELLNEYYSIYEQLNNEFGEKVILLYQVGSFYEHYSYETEIKQVGKAEEIARILNIICTRKNKKKPMSASNPNLVGFQVDCVDKFILPLIQNNYTVVTYNQVKKAEGIFRVRGHVYSPANYIEGSESKSRVIVVIYIDIKPTIISLAFAGANNITGKIQIAERYSKDIEQIKDIIGRMIINMDPIEILFYMNEETQRLMGGEENIIGYYDLKELKCRVIELKKEYLNIKYQQTLLEKIYFNSKNDKLSNNNLSNDKSTNASITSKIILDEEIISQLDMEKHPDALIAQCLLLQYIYKHDERLLKEISKPEIITDNGKLILLNDAAKQLSIIHGDNKNKSLYDIINFTYTNLGKNYLREQILSPITSIEELEQRYNIIDEFQKTDTSKIINCLKNIYNIERLTKKMIMRTLPPYEICALYKSIVNIKELYEVIPSSLYKIYYSKNQTESLDNCIKMLNKTFNIEYIQENINGKQSKTVIAEIFTDTCNDHIKDLKNYASSITDILGKIATKLDDYYYINFPKKTKKPLVNVELKNGSYVLTTTETRWEYIKKNMPKEELDKYTVKYKVQLTSDEIENISNNHKTRDISHEIYIAYIIELDKIKEELLLYYENHINMVANIDFYNSLAIASTRYSYTRPKLINNTHSYMKGIALRHPIIEQINQRNKFIPNNFDTLQPTLLFGVNGCGKSILLKTIGSIIIMAQIGCYVPAEYFELTPYNKIITRITYDDNMYRNQSSFMVEMTELRTILKYSDHSTIVLGDEICKGTETYSATAIVKTAIKTLVSKNIDFVFTTHLHTLSDSLKYLSNDNKLYIKHLSIHRNENNDIICDRLIKDGAGPSTYGIEVCKGIGLDGDFIIECNETRKELLGEHTELLNIKKSKYNSQLYVDHCEMCGSQKNLETDHINEQKNANTFGLIKESNGSIYHKNSLFNLMILCKECHNKKTYHHNLKEDNI